MGEIFKTVHKVIKSIKSLKPTMVIAVGDIIAMELEKKRFIPNVKIIDYKSRRKFGSSRYFLSGLAEPLTKNEAINEALTKSSITFLSFLSLIVPLVVSFH